MKNLILDWNCAGCKRRNLNFPPIKIPQKPIIDKNRGYPFYEVKYYLFCHKCASIILGKGIIGIILRFIHKLPKFREVDVRINGTTN